MKSLVLPQNDVHAGNLILVNQQFPFCERGEEHFLVPVSTENNQILLERRAAVILSKLMEELDGWSRITAVSGWRSAREQQNIFMQSLNENGTVFTEKYVAKPGHSEHQTGFAIDLGLTQPDIDFIRPDFPYSGICQTFRQRAAAFGFMERYPKDKESITGIAHEPWHFRYVGIPHAAIMTEMGLTLEEYLAFLRQFPYGKKCLNWQTDHWQFTVSYVEAAKNTDTQFEIDADILYSVSGDNIDGFIVTEWRKQDGEQ